MSWSKIDERTYQYDEDGVRFFLLLGSTKALLVDSGMQTRNAKELAKEITNLPLGLFNTHADIDHVGSNEEFNEIMMNPAELVNYDKPHASQNIIPVYDGDVIDLGDRELVAIALPGHTPGSTALLDKETGALFSGDPIQDGKIFMFGQMRNMAAYVHSLRRLKTFEKDIKNIYPCHGTCPVDFSIIDKLIDGAIKVENGEIIPEKAERFGQIIGVYDFGAAAFLGDWK